MPLIIEKFTPVRASLILEGELPDNDLCDGLLVSFKSPPFSSVAVKDRDSTKLKLAKFVNENFEGPFYFLEVENADNETQLTKEIFAIVLNSEDRKKFAAQFLKEDWQEIPESVLPNLRTIIMHAQDGFDFQNDTMNNLARRIKLNPRKNGKIDASYIEMVDKILSNLCRVDIHSTKPPGRPSGGKKGNEEFHFK